MKNIITKKLIAYISILGLIGTFIIYSVVSASDTASVSATVTVQNISLTVSDGLIDYGTLAANSTQDTCSNNLNDAQTVTNNGNVAETFNIQGQDSASWTLASTAGSDQYVESFATSSCTTWTSGTALSTSYATAASNVASSGTMTLNLQIHTPNPSTVFDSQDVSISLQAVAS